MMYILSHLKAEMVIVEEWIVWMPLLSSLNLLLIHYIVVVFLYQNFLPEISPWVRVLRLAPHK